MTSSRALILTVALFLVGCSATPVHPVSVPTAWFMKSEAPNADAKARILMIGRWFSDTNDPDGIRRMALETMHEDGTFEISFRSIHGGKVVTEQTEYGLWGVSGDINFMITQGYVEDGHRLPVSPKDPTYYDAYRIIRLTLDRFDCTHIVAGGNFQKIKVPDSFQFPSSDI